MQNIKTQRKNAVLKEKTIKYKQMQLKSKENKIIKKIKILNPNNSKNILKVEI